MAEILVREVDGTEEVAAARRLMQAYGEHLAGTACIRIEGCQQELENLPGGYSALLLATVEGIAAGCVALRLLDTEEQACEMKRLWVESGFRGMGVGRRLVEEAIGWAERMGYEAMYLDTAPAAMPEANRLYAAMGFVRVERYNKNPVADVVFFRRALGKITKDTPAFIQKLK